jgi:uncharacterized membrane protein YfcA
MTFLQGLAAFAAGIAAGGINAVVGSGSLVTFPTLLAIGYTPFVANVTNTVGVLPGSVSGAVGYRRELRGDRARRRAWVLGSVAVVGGLAGAALLLVFPGAFEGVVPVLVGIACVLVVLQPWLTRHLDARGRDRPDVSWPVVTGTLLTGVYGGYFGAAQSVILLSLFGLWIPDDLQRLNALKNVCTAAANGVAAIVFALVSHVAWVAAAVIAAGAVIGGQLGATVGRRLPPGAFRAAIVAVGVAAIVKLIVD